MHDSRLAKIESDIRGFVRASYPEMVVRAEYWAKDPSRIALFFIDERFRTLYPRQRYHYLVHLIPKDYYDSMLADTVWFELTPEERPEMVEDDPDEELIRRLRDVWDRRQSPEEFPHWRGTRGHREPCLFCSASGESW